MVVFLKIHNYYGKTLIQRHCSELKIHTACCNVLRKQEILTTFSTNLSGCRMDMTFEKKQLNYSH